MSPSNQLSTLAAKHLCSLPPDQAVSAVRGLAEIRHLSLNLEEKLKAEAKLATYLEVRATKAELEAMHREVLLTPEADQPEAAYLQILSLHPES